MGRGWLRGDMYCVRGDCVCCVGGGGVAVSETQYAVELVAITGKNRAMPAMLVAPVAGDPIILDDSQVTGRTIVPLECSQDRAEAIVKVLQMNMEPVACGIYRRNGKDAWKKLAWKRTGVTP